MRATALESRTSAERRAPGVRSTPSRQRRLPWIALGLLLVFGAGLAFAAWTQATSRQVAVLVAARDVDAGEVVTAAAVRTEQVAVGPGVTTVESGERQLVVGKVARGPIPAGTLLNPALVAEGDVVPAGQAVVGAVLVPGAYPTASLRPGDHVQLVAAAATTDPSAVLEPLGDARVWAVTDLDAPGTPGLFISLLVPADRAGAVTNAGAQQRLRLVLVAAGQ